MFWKVFYIENAKRYFILVNV